MLEGMTSLNSPAERFNEETLIRRIREGEHELFYELIRPYERRVYSAALAILRNEADAEDAAQEAMLKAFKHIRQFRAEARLKTNPVAAPSSLMFFAAREIASASVWPAFME